MTARATEKMESKDVKNQTASENAAEAAREADFSEELGAPRWSVMSFDEVAVRGLSYEEAARWLDKLRSQNVHGLCIVTDEAANRFSRKN